MVLFQALGFAAKDLSGETLATMRETSAVLFAEATADIPANERVIRQDRTAPAPAARSRCGSIAPSTRRARCRLPVDPRRRDDLREHRPGRPGLRRLRGERRLRRRQRRVPPRPRASAPGAGRGLLRRAPLDGRTTPPSSASTRRGSRSAARARAAGSRPGPCSGARPGRARPSRSSCSSTRCSTTATRPLGPGSRRGPRAGAASTTSRAGRRAGRSPGDRRRRPLRGARAGDRPRGPAARAHPGRRARDVFRDEDIDFAARLLRGRGPDGAARLPGRLSRVGHGRAEARLSVRMVSRRRGRALRGALPARPRRRLITCHVRTTRSFPSSSMPSSASPQRWMELVERHGGIHRGYFLPAEGASDIAYAALQLPEPGGVRALSRPFGVDPDFVDADRIRDESGCCGATSGHSCARCCREAG